MRWNARVRKDPALANTPPPWMETPAQVLNTPAPVSSTSAPVLRTPAPQDQIEVFDSFPQNLMTWRTMFSQPISDSDNKPGAEEAKNKFMTSVFDELDGCKIGLSLLLTATITLKLRRLNKHSSPLRKGWIRSWRAPEIVFRCKRAPTLHDCALGICFVRTSGSKSLGLSTIFTLWEYLKSEVDKIDTASTDDLRIFISEKFKRQSSTGAG
ncbi:hypothetical protein MMC22_010195 [Lobaria immixta]|nr:hypothetical protein [Lobaria immixta]